MSHLTPEQIPAGGKIRQINPPTVAKYNLVAHWVARNWTDGYLCGPARLSVTL
jgi:hypothetical protein